MWNDVLYEKLQAGVGTKMMRGMGKSFRSRKHETRETVLVMSIVMCGR